MYNCPHGLSCTKYNCPHGLTHVQLPPRALMFNCPLGLSPAQLLPQALNAQLPLRAHLIDMAYIAILWRFLLAPNYSTRLQCHFHTNFLPCIFRRKIYAKSTLNARTGVFGTLPLKRVTPDRPGTNNISILGSSCHPITNSAKNLPSGHRSGQNGADSH